MVEHGNHPLPTPSYTHLPLIRPSTIASPLRDHKRSPLPLSVLAFFSFLSLQIFTNVVSGPKGNEISFASRSAAAAVGICLDFRGLEGREKDGSAREGRGKVGGGGGHTLIIS